MFRKGPSELFPGNGQTRVYLDTETTGLEIPDAVILSIAFIVDRVGEDGKYATADTLDIVINPTDDEWAKASPGALKVNGMTKEFLDEHGIAREEARKELTAFILKNNLNYDTAYLVGQNPKFDIKFLQHYYPSLDWLGFPYRSVVDNISYAQDLMQYDFTFKPRKLSGHYLSKALGVEEEDAVHTAMGGAEVVKRNFLEIERRLISVLDTLRSNADNDVESKDMPRAVIAPSNTLAEFKEYAKDDFVPFPGKPLWFSDKSGFRWEWYGGRPNILVNLNTTP